jgi:hypothetical protein
MSMWFADRIFRVEVMFAPEGWYAAPVFVFIAAVAALALYGFLNSLGSQSAFPVKMLDR